MGGGHAAEVGTDLVRCYEERHRHYHTLTHIEECLGEAASVPLDEPSRARLCLAIWFHDAVYAIGCTDNEVQSAELFRRSAPGLPAGLVEDVALLILATQRHEVTPQNDSPLLRLFLDIDLAILGAPAERFARYDREIRQEYASIPLLFYAPKRKKALRRFLDRPPIYSTELFRDRYEASARANLLRVLGL